MPYSKADVIRHVMRMTDRGYHCGITDKSLCKLCTELVFNGGGCGSHDGNSNNRSTRINNVNDFLNSLSEEEIFNALL